MPASRDATQDCSNDSNSATSLTATFPGGAAAAGRLLVAVARIGTSQANVTRPAPSDLFALDMSGGPCLVGVAKIAAGGETGMTFSQSTGGGVEMTVAAFQYLGALSPLAIDKTATNPGDFAQHASWATGTTAATTQADELFIEAAALAGTATAPSVSSGTLIANLRSNELLIAERIVLATGTYNDTFSWTNNNFVVAGIATIKAAPVDPKPIMGFY